jgi:glycosyltransferase involved in cell wall biosynthesis
VLLSIVMMMKNEEKYLNKTLTALQPLMKKINSELIILDTGSTDKSIDIAKKFTDKIYFEKWNNNFGDMRNKSISHAKGDWILILDADEELTNCIKMIDFFDSEKYKKYNCASIELKNIFSENNYNYNKSSIIRLFKNNKNFRYEGAIHEQPLYQKPIYNDIASFNHYGYMYINEEVRQKKLRRNENILFSELKNNPNDPYLNFQIAKNYMCYGDKEEALYYMEKSYELYKRLGIINKAIYVYTNLTKLYIMLHKYEKCEKMCQYYIKNDDKNIDIYYYLALSQKSLGKYRESLSNYKRYMFMLDNYELSTQANNVSCDADTVGFKESVDIDLVNIYYFLDMYDEIIKKSKEMKFEQVKKIYFIIFMSLYRLDRLEEIIELYSRISNYTVEKKEFKINLEKMILSIKESDRENVYKLLSKIDDNYGLLNEIRLGKRLTVKEYNEIILKEKEIYYGDIVYYALKKDIDLITLLNGISHLCVQNYMNYIISNRRDCILDLYKYLLNAPNTLDINKLNVYSSLSKALLFSGSLLDEKYENLFFMYIMYKYDYLRRIYNENISDEELLNFVKDEEDKFIINLEMIRKTKNEDKLEYIKEIKKLLIDNPQYKKGIKILIDKFEKEFKESEELKILKAKYKDLIEESVNSGNLDDSIRMIKEYEEIYSEEDIYNIKAIINIYMKNIEESNLLLKFAYFNNKYDINVLFNIAYIKESIGELEESRKFYQEILKINNDAKINEEIIDKLKTL